MAGASGVFMLLVIGYLVNDGFNRPATPPDISVSVDSVSRTRRGYLVHVGIRNDGHTTAAALHLRGELRDSAGVAEEADLVIDFVPAEGRRRAGLFFGRDPRAHTLVVRPMGYDLP